MKNTKKVVYMVTYFDDNRKQHITFVEGFSAVRFLEDRFNDVYFEKTETYLREDDEYDDNEALMLYYYSSPSFYV